jgi:hypothetical protein
MTEPVNTETQPIPQQTPVDIKAEDNPIVNTKQPDGNEIKKSKEDLEIEEKEKKAELEAEKKKAMLERQTAIIVDAVKEYVGGKRITSVEIVRVIAHAMSIAAKMSIDNKNKKIVVIAGVKAYINGTDWQEDDKIVLCEFIDLTIEPTIDTIAAVHTKKIDLTQPKSVEIKSSNDSQKSCCVIM